MRTLSVIRERWSENSWKKLLQSFLIFGLITMLGSRTTVRAAFEDNGTGARPTGLGNAYTALADDVLALYYNPAGLARVQQVEASSEYSRLYNGLSDGSRIGQY